MSNGLQEGWKEYRLVETASPEKYSFTGGPFGSNLKSEEYTEKGIRIIQLQNIGDGCFFDYNKIFTSEKKADELFSCDIFPGDIVLSKRGDPVARATIIPNSSSRYLMASDGIRLSVDKKTFETKFILETINFIDFRKQAEISSTGTTRKRIGLTELRELTLFSPPLPEQKKIAKILSSVDEVIETTETQINKLKDLKKGMMNELLTKDIGHTEFKDLPVGRIPVGWEYVSIFDVCEEIFLGLTSKVDYVEKNGVPLIRATDISGGKLSFNKAKEISNKQHLSLTKFRKAKKGDILISKSGSLGVCALVKTDKDFSIYESIIVLQPKNAVIISEFLLWVMRSKETQNRLLGDTVGSTVGHLNLKDFRKLKIPFLSIDEQQKLAKILSSIDTNIEQKQTKLTQSKNLKKSLMADLLTGRVRVKP